MDCLGDVQHTFLTIWFWLESHWFVFLFWVFSEVCRWILRRPRHLLHDHGFSAFCSWLLMSGLGPWFLVLGVWFLLLGSWSWRGGSGYWVLGSWSFGLGPSFLDLGAWLLVLFSGTSRLGTRSRSSWMKRSDTCADMTIFMLFFPAYGIGLRFNLFDVYIYFLKK